MFELKHPYELESSDDVASEFFGKLHDVQRCPARHTLSEDRPRWPPPQRSTPLSLEIRSVTSVFDGPPHWLRGAHEDPAHPTVPSNVPEASAKKMHEKGDTSP